MPRVYMHGNIIAPWRDLCTAMSVLWHTIAAPRQELRTTWFEVES
jgi:hypothetical protein